MASPSQLPYEYEEIVELNYDNDGTLSSRSAEVCEGYYQLLVSIYFKNNNPNKQQLIKSFNDLMSRDIYEIVV